MTLNKRLGRRLLYQENYSKSSTHRSTLLYALVDQLLPNISKKFLIKATVRALAVLLGIDAETIEIYGAFEGSLILNLGIPSTSIGELTALLRQDSKELKSLTVKVKDTETSGYEQQTQLTITKIMVESQAEAEERWILKDNRYQRLLRTTVSSRGSSQNQKVIGLIKKAKSKNQFVLLLNGMGLTELPREIGTLIQLRTLSLASNKLTSLPAEIENLINLKSLNLRNNQFTTLPNEIGNLQNLRKLDIRGNLIFELPENLEKLIKRNQDFILKHDSDIMFQY